MIAAGPGLSAEIRAKAHDLGFDAVGFAEARLPPEAGARLRALVSAGHHGEMGWMAERMEQRADPRGLWPEVRSVISLGMSYAPADDALATLGKPDRGNLSVYARNRDYHDVIKGKLKHLAQFIVSRASEAQPQVKVFVDTAPVMEKPLAAEAGLGWQGKHTNLVSRQHGSWLFLGEILTTLDLPVDQPHADRCGSC
ncbi:MAG TPA: tRNA epoxyqueuosine(34) reductase QueG, partial [Acidisoma sp.]|uniref:tRNA epoxyqueuosine(34) reductase QueG n=1 Tax=Acidisoma sp. TaxID=1872115 RepID=UPI002B58F423